MMEPSNISMGGILTSKEARKYYVELTHCGEELNQARQRRVSLMCWRIAHGYRAAKSAVAPDETQCPPMNIKF